jgi:hypothetical protein
MAPALQLVLAADSPAAQALPALCQPQALLALRPTPSGAAQAVALAVTATTRQLTAALAVLAV